MPNNKFAVIRYRVIDNLLTHKQKKYPTLEDFSKACENLLYTPVATRTIREDIRAMKDDEGLGYFAPIKYSRAHQGYYYEDTKYTIHRMPLSSTDLEAVDYAAKLLGQFAGSVNFQKYAGAVERLVDTLSIEKKSASAEGFPFIYFDTTTYYKGGERLEQLVEWTRDKQPLEIQYQAFDKQAEQTYTLHPYCLKEYKNRWYIIGYIEERKDIRTFGLDRILNVKPKEISYYQSPTFHPDSYFKYSFGISIGNGQPEHIRLRFFYPQANYIQTQHLHPSQKIYLETDSYIEIQLFVVVTYELKSMILGFGEDIEVLSPDSLRQEWLLSLYKTWQKAQ